jgi:dTDP-4-dehydrorhamnose 3,5-epimerase
LNPIEPLEQIEGAQVARLRAFGDERGRFMETFRTEWFPQRTWQRLQCNRSDSKAGVLRGLHYHFKQIDYWYVPHGRLLAALVDIRPDSPTYLHSATIELGDNNEIGLFIPVGVAHGFIALSDVTLTYTVDNYFDGSDEHGVAWNDPAFGLEWGVSDPVISERDQHNRLLKDIPLSGVPLLYP